MVSFFATLFTGIGGHYVNRRWDRAVFFFCLFVFYLGIIWGLLLLSYLRADSGIDLAQFLEKKVQIASLMSFVGVLILWIISLAVTMLDKWFQAEQTLATWTKSGMGAAVFTTALACLIGVSSVVLMVI